MKEYKIDPIARQNSEWDIARAAQEEIKELQKLKGFKLINVSMSFNSEDRFWHAIIVYEVDAEEQK